VQESHKIYMKASASSHTSGEARSSW